MSDSVPGIGSILPFDSSIYWLENLNPDYVNSIHVVSDEMIVTGANFAPVVMRVIDKALVNKMLFTSAGNLKGALYMLIMSDQTATGYPYMQYYTQVKFIDG